MKKSCILPPAVVLLTVLLPISVSAQTTRPIQISLYHPVQIFNKDVSVRGIRLNVLYGVNNDLTGIDYGFIVNKLEGDLTGVQFGLVNLVDGNVTGYQDGLVNVVNNDFIGWQNGFVTITKGSLTGLNTGVYTKNGEMHGLQIGVVNITGKLDGLQIGLVNINKSATPHKFLPIINYSF